MERLTKYNQAWKDYSCADHTLNIDIRDHLYTLNQKLGKLEDLMEKYKVKDLEELELMISTYIDNRGEY